ncbi:glycine betaine ABC transporter substrate-binding protein, partial [Rhizobium ruizarguesonis]
ETGSPEQLDASIARAFENKVVWLGYYWAPTAILGKYDMTRLSFGVGHNKSEWDRCTAVAGLIEQGPDGINPVFRGDVGGTFLIHRG